ncbi:Exocyst complex component SEC5A [Smittium mucronatum]|uniref:Exocyst complex component SEC5 n=1 Tax=Smittium mucronatum TaxID=133383 RepID=A0A1R0GVZ6_9FUNG|nr:Exocyst complex component SEC5A [Smittium mucronatum]
MPDKMKFEDHEVLNYYGIESYNATSWGSSQFDRPENPVIEDIEIKEKFNYEQEAEDSLRNAIDPFTGAPKNTGDSPPRDLDQEDNSSDPVPSKRFYAPVYKDYDPLGLKPSINSALAENRDLIDPSDLSQRGKYFVSHKQFSATDFLLAIHKDASYSDLIHGAKALRLAMSHRSEALKVLVKNNFGRFVEAKNKIDLLYDEMKTHSFGQDQEYGTKKFQDAIKKCTDNAEKIYNPIISRRNKADKIRSTLSVVGRYKFFFNLPHSLIELTRLNKFDSAVREYKKGKILLRQLKFNSGQVGSDLRQATALDFIVDKVWEEVQNSLIELRSALYVHLSQSYRPLDTQEVVIRHLYDLDLEPEEDPVGFYLKKQYLWISEQMEEVHENLSKKQKNLSLSIKPILHSASVEESIEAKENRRAEELLRALHAQGISDYNSDSTVRDEAFVQWRIIFNAIKGISTTLVRCIPDFWRLAEAYIDNKYSSDSDSFQDDSKRKFALSLVENLILEYCSHLFKIMFMHSKSADSEKNNFESKSLGDFIPNTNIRTISMTDVLLSNFEDPAEHHGKLIDIDENPDKVESLASKIQSNLPQTHTILTGYFMTGIVDTVVGSANDISALKISPQLSHILQIMVSQLKSGLLYVLCEYWEEDSKTFHLQETWKLRYGTEHWPQFYVPKRRQQQSSKSSNLDLSSANAADQATERAAKTIANTDIVPLYLRAQQSILGTIEAICTSSSNMPKFSQSYQPSTEFVTSEKFSSKLNAMSYNRTSLVFFDSIHSFLDSLHFLAIHGVVDKRRKSNLANSNSGSNNILPYVNKALLFLVFVHAEILDLVSDTETDLMNSRNKGDFDRGARQLSQQPLIKRVFQTLYADMLMDLTRSFRSVDSFSDKGLMQAVLELLFVSQTLSNYSSPATDECYRLLFGYLSQTYSKSLKSGLKSSHSISDANSSQVSINSDGLRSNKYHRSNENQPGNEDLVGPPESLALANQIKLLPQQWDLIQSLIKKCTRHTSIQFRCFRA